MKTGTLFSIFLHLCPSVQSVVAFSSVALRPPSPRGVSTPACRRAVAAFMIGPLAKDCGPASIVRAIALGCRGGVAGRARRGDYGTVRAFPRAEDRGEMATTTDYLALDLGAESGRGMLGRFDGERLGLEEMHRFPNGPVRMLDTLYWDLPRLFDEIVKSAEASELTL